MATPPPTTAPPAAPPTNTNSASVNVYNDRVWGVAPGLADEMLARQLTIDSLGLDGMVVMNPADINPILRRRYVVNRGLYNALSASSSSSSDSSASSDDTTDDERRREAPPRRRKRRRHAPAPPPKRPKRRRRAR